MTSPATAVADVGRAIDSQDWGALEALLAPGFRCRLVHTGEELDRERYVRLNREYPGSWRFLVRDQVAQGERACGLATVTDGDETHHVAFFLTVRDGQVVEAVEVWAEESEVPHERRPG